MVKKIFSILAWVVTGVALVVLFIAARDNYLNMPLKSINVNIDRVNDNGFVKESTVTTDLGNICNAAKIGTLNMQAIQSQLKSNPWVQNSAAYVDLGGDLNVSIKEHHPVLRIFGSNGKSVYLTDDRIVLPPSSSHTPYLLIASGNFRLDSLEMGHQLNDTLKADQNLIGAMAVMEAIGRNPFIKSCTGQIYCNRQNEFEIVVRDLDARVVLGDIGNLDDKLRRLEIFMKQKIGTNEIKNLNIINLKYKNQVVCTKR